MKKLVKRTRKIFKLIQTMTIRRGGFKRPLLAGLAIDDHTYIEELWMPQLLSQLLQDTGIFIDIGANIGQTMLALRSVHPGVEYIGFEPNPACVFYMDELIKKNAFENAHVISVGLSNREQVIPLWISSGHVAGAGSTFEKKVKSLKKKVPHFVPAFTLDKAWEDMGLGNPSFIKIDVEGHEPEVLKGALKTIQTHEPFLSIEFIPPIGEDDQNRADYNSTRSAIQEALQQIVEDINYRIFRIITAKDSSLVGLRRLDKFSVASREKELGHPYKSIEKYKQDYLLVPSSRLSEVRALTVQ